MTAHYLEHFVPPSLSVPEEVNFSRESSFYQLGSCSRFNKYLLQCKAGNFALKLLEVWLLSILKWEVVARRCLQRGGDGVHS